MKERGVSANVHPDFYRFMEMERVKLWNNHKIKVSSHVKLTKLMADSLGKNKRLFQNKQWLMKVKMGGF